MSNPASGNVMRTAAAMTEFLEGDYADGRRTTSFASLDDVRRKNKLLQKALRAQLKRIDE